MTWTLTWAQTCPWRTPGWRYVIREKDNSLDLDSDLGSDLSMENPRLEVPQVCRDSTTDREKPLAVVM